MIGQKGVPATHGGVERHVEELGARLAKMGHEVVVFTRPNYTKPGLKRCRGMDLVSVPAPEGKHLEATAHSLRCAMRTLREDFDVVHFHALGPSLMSPIPRLRGHKVVSTVHGQDWRRAKWGRMASLALRVGEQMALRVPHATVSVSSSLARAYSSAGHEVDYIPNGVTVEEGNDHNRLREWGLRPRSYVLYAGRLVPEKGAHVLIEAHARSGCKLPLAIAGGTSHTDEYVEELKRLAAGRNVKFLGYIYGPDLATAFRNAALFVLPSELEGQPIVLLEAVAYGVPVIASDIPPNIETLGEDGVYFRVNDVESLAETLQDAVRNLAASYARMDAVRQRVLREHDWDSVAVQTEALYMRLLGKGAGERVTEGRCAAL